MNKALNFIRSCVRRGINTDDLGYMTKDYFQYVDNDNDEQGIITFFGSISDRCVTNFFDQPKTINTILDHYHQFNKP